MACAFVLYATTRTNSVFAGALDRAAVASPAAICHLVRPSASRYFLPGLEKRTDRPRERKRKEGRVTPAARHGLAAWLLRLSEQRSVRRERIEVREEAGREGKGREAREKIEKGTNGAAARQRDGGSRERGRIRTEDECRRKEGRDRSQPAGWLSG